MNWSVLGLAFTLAVVVTLAVFFRQACRNTHVRAWQDRCSCVALEWLAKPAFPLWLFAYLLGSFALALDFTQISVRYQNAKSALPSLYKVTAIIVNVYATYPIYKLLLRHLNDLDTNRQHQRLARVRYSTGLISTHLVFAYISAIGGYAWACLYGYTAGLGHIRDWNTLHGWIIVWYVIVSTGLMIAALWNVHWLIDARKYDAYAAHYLSAPSGSSDSQHGDQSRILLPGVWPEMINNPLSFFRIALALLSIAAAVAPT